MKNKLFFLSLLCVSSFVMAQNQGLMSYADLLEQVESDLEGIGFLSDDKKPAELQRIIKRQERIEALRLAFLELGFLDQSEQELALSRLYKEYLRLNGVTPDDSTDRLSTNSKFMALQNFV